ncbi:MAG: nodulation protein NfeD [Acidobacteriia bacterium]|nr:nodulation protein NfeD [Terriglobia bacterium]
MRQRLPDGRELPRRFRWATMALLGMAALLPLRAVWSANSPAPAAAGPSPVVVLKIDKEVEPVLATYIGEGLDQAAARHAALVLITMDTPGGLSDSMREIIARILASPVPVAVYVSPAGARGASAGFFILLSADVAAMGPGTHTGSASPVMAIGGFSVQIDETMKKKIFSDSTAYLRSYAGQRGRNPALAETAITEARAFTEKEALEGKLVDLIASSEADLLRQLDGREITRFDGTRVKLALAQPVLSTLEMSSRQRFLARIVEPDLFFVLLIFGVLGLYAEFTHPGLIFPGVIGGICLLLALYAMHFLPVNAAGLLLIFLALALFMLEAKFTSHGILAGGGVLAMFLGAIFLIRSPLTRGGVSLSIALAVTLPFAVLTIVLMRLVLRSRGWKASAGREEMIGVTGTVVTAIPGGLDGAQKEGMVRVRGELWRAVAAQAAGEGELVRIVSVDGLTLRVEAAGAAAAGVHK